MLPCHLEGAPCFQISHPMRQRLTMSQLYHHGNMKINSLSFNSLTFNALEQLCLGIRIHSHVARTHTLNPQCNKVQLKHKGQRKTCTECRVRAESGAATARENIASLILQMDEISMLCRAQYKQASVQTGHHLFLFRPTTKKR